MAVTRLEVTRREPVLGGARLGAGGAYEKIEGVLHFAVDPARPPVDLLADAVGEILSLAREGPRRVEQRHARQERREPSGPGRDHEVGIVSPLGLHPAALGELSFVESSPLLITPAPLELSEALRGNARVQLAHDHRDWLVVGRRADLVEPIDESPRERLTSDADRPRADHMLPISAERHTEEP